MCTTPYFLRLSKYVQLVVLLTFPVKPLSRCPHFSADKAKVWFITGSQFLLINSNINWNFCFNEKKKMIISITGRWGVPWSTVQKVSNAFKILNYEAHFRPWSVSMLVTGVILGGYFWFIMSLEFYPCFMGRKMRSKILQNL